MFSDELSCVVFEEDSSLELSEELSLLFSCEESIDVFSSCFVSSVVLLEFSLLFELLLVELFVDDSSFFDDCCFVSDVSSFCFVLFCSST